MWEVYNRKDVRTEFKSWYVIDGNEHLKMGSFSDATDLMKIRARQNPPRQLIMMSDKEYSKWHKRKTKQ